MKKNGKRITAWLMACIMVWSLVLVPAGKVEAAAVSVELNSTTGSTTTTADSSGNVEVRFDVPEEYNTTDKVKAAGINKLEVTFKVTSYSGVGSNTPGAQAFLGHGKAWDSNGSWQNIETGKEITSILDLSSFLSSSESIYAYGIQFANLSGDLTYEIVSAKLTGPGTWDVENDSISLSYTSQNQYNSYIEYKFTVKNTGSSAVNGDLVITFDQNREKNWWTEDFPISLSGNTLTVSNVSVAAGASSKSIQVQLKPMGANITSVSFAGKTISAEETKLSDSGNTGGSGSSGGDSTFDGTDIGEIDTSLDYNFAKLLQYSLYFYDANMCGDQVSETSLYSKDLYNGWRGDCHVNDQFTYNGKTYSAVGGYHDAGDHVKFGLPMAEAMTALGIGYHEFGEAFDELNQTQHFKTIVDYYCTYVKNCTVLNSAGTQAEAFCYQIGNGDKDHANWTAPEVEDEGKTARNTALVATAQNPATDIVSGTAAALALNYMNFGNEEDLKYAKALFAFAKNTSGKREADHDGSFYHSGWGSWEDEYCLAAGLLYRITKDETYATEYTNNEKNSGNIEKPYGWENAYQPAVFYAPDSSSSKVSQTNTIRNWFNSVANANKSQYYCNDAWGSARINCNVQLMMMVSDKLQGTDVYSEWCRYQMSTILGNNSTGKNLICGYNTKSPVKPHHRAASGYSGWDGFNSDATQKYTLYGALCGGPTSSDYSTYNDSVKDAVSNEVTLDYNAGLVGAAAALYLKYKDSTEEGFKNQTISDTFYGGSKFSGGSSVTYPVEAVTVSPTEATLEIGDTETLKVTVTPANATNKKVTWSSSNDKIASVNAKGVVTAVAAGTATITVTTEDGEKTATCEVTVKKPDPLATEIVGEDTIDVKVGDTLSKVDLSSYVVKAGTDNVTEQGVLSWKETDKTFAAADDGAQYTLVFTPKDAEAYVATEKKITFHVTKLANAKKAVAPIIKSRTDNSVTLAAYEGTEAVEYGRQAGDKYVWQTAPVFERLSPYTAYTFAMRFAETEEMTAGEAGDSTKVITYLAEKDRYTVDVSLVNDANYVGAHAGTITYDGNSKTLTLEEDKEYTLTGSNPDVKVIAKNKDLILKDATIKGIEAKKDLNLRLSGDNTVKSAGIISEGTITIEDEGNSSVVGKLDVEGDNFGAIVADTVIIKSGQITATGTGDAVAIKAATKIELVGGTLIANADKQPFICAGDGSEENPGKIILDGCLVPSEADTIYNVTPKDSQGNDVNFWMVVFQGAEKDEYSVPKGSKIQLINVPVKKGFHVKGWQAAGTDEVLAAGTEVEVTADITFIPVYEEITGALVLTPDASAAPLTEGYEADAGVTVTIENGTNVDWDAVTFALASSNFVLDTTEVDSFKQGAKKTLHVTLKEGMEAADYETTLTVSVKPEGEMEPQHVVIKRSVQAKQEEIKNVSKIVVSLDQTKVELAAEDGATATVKATATITPADAKDKTVKWSVDNTDVATVNAKGVITAKAAGVVQITATAQDGSTVSDSAILTVTKKKKEDSGKTDPVTPNPVDPAPTEPITPSNPGKDDSGKEDSGKQDPNTDKPSTGNNQTPANKPNTTGETDEVKATAIQVTADVKKAEDLLATGTMKLAPKKKMQLNVAFLPEDAEEEELTFTSSNPKIATVDEDGEIVAGKKAGKTTITVRSAGGLTKTFRIQVMKKAVSKVKLQTKTKNLKVGKTLKIKAMTLPSKKYASSSILWISSNENIATVSPKGVVKGLKAGKVKITAVATDGSGKKAMVTIKVK